MEQIVFNGRCINGAVFRLVRARPIADPVNKTVSTWERFRSTKHKQRIVSRKKSSP